MECFDILDDLSDELEIFDYYQFVLMNELVYELTYKVIRRIEYYYRTIDNSYYHYPYPEFRWKDNCKFVGCGQYRTIREYASYSGDLESLKRLCGSGYDGRIIPYAICKSHLDILNWVYDNHKEMMIDKYYKHYWLNHACYNGHLDVMKWLFDKFPDELPFWRVDRCVTTAIEREHLDVLKWIYECKKGSIPYLNSDSSRYLSSDIVCWMLSIGHYYSNDIIEWARKYRRDDVIEYLCRNKPDEIIKFILGPEPSSSSGEGSDE